MYRKLRIGLELLITVRNTIGTIRRNRIRSINRITNKKELRIRTRTINKKEIRNY